ncbi:unnamed protein product [Miscanthus lutarioriparius]|uniref:Uncharacterized protein n=1 Tax=Miscanthus lutarioriparius TaxID=422564 RepID=A0A811MVB0_9POAL|nr:unnamed protein product [Miscanthus lutarioriparius]
MARRSLKARPTLVLISLLLMADLAIVGYGRRVAELDVLAVGDSGGGDRGSPPRKGCCLSNQASSSASGRHLGDCCKHMHVVSKSLFSGFSQMILCYGMTIEIVRWESHLVVNCSATPLCK